MYFGCFDFRGEIGFLNCDDVCMCVVDKQFELLKFVFKTLCEVNAKIVDLLFLTKTKQNILYNNKQ